MYRWDSECRRWSPPSSPASASANSGTFEEMHTKRSMMYNTNDNDKRHPRMQTPAKTQRANRPNGGCDGVEPRHKKKKEEETSTSTMRMKNRRGASLRPFEHNAMTNDN